MVHEYVYTLGLAGNRTKVEEFRYDEGSSRPALAERTVRYIYDDLYRLVHEIVTVKNSAGTGTQWQRTDTFTYDKVGNRKTMQRKTINQQTDVLYDYNAADQLLCETATTLQREAGGGYAAAPRPTRFAGVALGSIAALAFACLLAPFALLRTSGQGRKARRNRRFVACVSAFFVPLMAIDPSHVYALHEEAMAYQALAAAGLATVDPNTQVTTYDYDANGNMVEKVVDNPSTGIKTTLYTYDAENRLATVDDGSGVGGVVSYAYDADGIRTSKLVGVTLTTYVVDKNRPYAQVLEERLEVGGVSTVVKRYVYGHDLLSQTDRPGGGQYASTSYFHYDGQMSTRALSQGATVISDPTPAPLGSVIAKYSYDAFGSSLDLQGNLLPAGSTSATDYLYTGEQHDANAGFYYLRARYYSPGVGRFITRDTYQGSAYDPVSLHRYLYANADPVNRRDPSGYMTLVELTFAVSIIAFLLSSIIPALHTARDQVERDLVGIEGTPWQSFIGPELDKERQRDMLETRNPDLLAYKMDFWRSLGETNKLVIYEQRSLDSKIYAASDALAHTFDYGATALGVITSVPLTGRVLWSSTHGTPNHWSTIVDNVNMRFLRDDVVEIYANKWLKTSTEGAINSRLRPDWIEITTSGKYRIFEVRSERQRLGTLLRREMDYRSLLGDKLEEYQILEIGQIWDG